MKNYTGSGIVGCATRGSREAYIAAALALEAAIEPVKAVEMRVGDGSGLTFDFFLERIINHLQQSKPGVNWEAVGAQTDFGAMDTAAIIALLKAGAGELKAREQAKPERCYLVEGTYEEPEAQITGDLVMAADGDTAQTEVERVRGVSADEWVVDLVQMPIERVMNNLETLEMTPERVRDGLEETLESLGGARCAGCNKPFNADELDEDERCVTCIGVAG